jgi:hypothetical protein
MADGSPAAALLRSLGAPIWDLVTTAIDEHVTHWHRPPATDTRPHRQPIDRLPITCQQLSSAQELLRLGASLPEVAESLDMNADEFHAHLQRQYMADYFRICERALSEQPVDQADHTD